jgi:hypothetical protein
MITLILPSHLLIFFGFGYVATAGPHFHEQDNDLGNLLNSNAEQEHGWP